LEVRVKLEHNKERREDRIMCQATVDDRVLFVFPYEAVPLEERAQ
jgi:hypothetical protein